MDRENADAGRPYIRYAMVIVILTIGAVAAIAMVFWLTGKKDHVDIISVVATLTMASVGILIVVISLDLNAKTLRQNESMIRQNERLIKATEYAGNPYFDRDSFTSEGTFDSLRFSITNTGGKPAFITKIEVKIRGKRFVDAELVPPGDRSSVEAGGIFSYTLEIDKMPGGTHKKMSEYDPSEKNDELIVIKMGYRNLEHKGIEGMKDVVVVDYLTRDLNVFLVPKQ
jgi:hypothetical protein